VEEKPHQLVTQVEADRQSVGVKRLWRCEFQTQLKIRRESFGDVDFIEW